MIGGGDTNNFFIIILFFIIFLQFLLFFVLYVVACCCVCVGCVMCVVVVVRDDCSGRVSQGRFKLRTNTDVDRNYSWKHKLSLAVYVANDITCILLLISFRANC